MVQYSMSASKNVYRLSTYCSEKCEVLALADRCTLVICHCGVVEVVGGQRSATCRVRDAPKIDAGSACDCNLDC